MTTVSSKHVPRETGDPPMTVYQGQTLVDDMEIIRKICLPDRVQYGRNTSHLTFGKPDGGPLLSTHQRDFLHPGPAQDGRGERQARSNDMRAKHFEFSFGPPPLAQSENRAAFVPHGFPRDKKIFNIGAPNNKNASNVFMSDPDRDRWAADLESTNRADYLDPGRSLKNPYKKEIAQDHRSNHFEFGDDVPDMESLTKQAYKAPPPGIHRPDPIKGTGPSVQLGTPDYPWAREINSTNRQDFCAPFVAEEDALTEFVQRTPLQFGDDRREMLTEYRGAYKKNEYLDCSHLTDAQLTMLGVTREQVLPRKLPLELMSEGFRNSLGQSAGKSP
eukprot:EG_transcript_10599